MSTNLNKKPIIVLKVGTSTLMDPTTQLPSVRNMGNLVETVVDLRRRGFDVVLVTSGAVGFGCKAIGLKERPPTLPGKQAMAALGQSELMRVYRMMFDMLNTLCAQLLITRTDFVHRTRYVNFKNTLDELLRLNVVPIINENDSAATEELRFGDNDSLSAHIAVLCNASWLFLLTDVDCLYTSNPRTNPDAKAVSWVPKLEHLKVDTGASVGGTSWGTGGMATKLVAAQIATAAGVHTVLANGMYPYRVFEILKRENPTTQTFEGAPADSEISTDGGFVGHQNFAALPWPGTIFRGVSNSIQTFRTRRKWILSLPIKGRILVDAGAARALKKGRSLLAVGVKGVRGKFLADESVVIVAPADYQSASASAASSATGVDADLWDNVIEIAHCLVAVGSAQIKEMKGKKSEDLAKVMGYSIDPEIAHRQDIVLLSGGSAVNNADESEIEI